MFIYRSSWTNHSGQTYHSIWLKESFRENGKVKSRYILNLKDWPPEAVQSLQDAINICKKTSISSSETTSANNSAQLRIEPKQVSLLQGLSVGALFTVHQIAIRLGIVQALGNHLQAKLALWQIYARVIEQGSRLSAVRMANLHAVASILQLPKAFTENDLYKNLKWLNQNQNGIEDKLFAIRYSQKNASPSLFLYDVTSTYLEGEKNELAQFGYNRDKKKGKLQIVVGLLCDNNGVPVSIEVFEGNTQDTKTVLAQIKKIRERFGCQKVTFVGDRGMLKTASLKDLKEAELAYITAITRPQIETLLKAGTLEYSLFDKNLCEAEYNGVRYIFRRNPTRAEEIQNTRDKKQKKLEELLVHENIYLCEHPKAQVKAALERVWKKIEQLKCDKWLSVAVSQEKNRHLKLVMNDEVLKELQRLDGCYVLKTDVPKEMSPKEEIHGRYKDLALVESAFRTCKTVSLELRPLYVRLSSTTHGHVFVVMLAYMIVQELNKLWMTMDITVEEGLKHLTTLTEQTILLPDGSKIDTLPSPSEQNKKLLEAAGVVLPQYLVNSDVIVGTHKHKKKAI